MNFTVEHRLPEEVNQGEANDLPVSDIQLWDRFQQGDLKALEYIYNQHQPRLYAYGMGLVRNSDLVKDTLHDLFVALWQKRESYSRIENIKAYLFTIMRRQLLRKAQEEGQLLRLNTNDTFLQETVSSPEKSWLQQEIDKELHTKLQEAMRRLSRKQQELLYLRYHAQCSNVDIAKITGMGHRKVGYILRTTLKALKIILQ